MISKHLPVKKLSLSVLSKVNIILLKSLKKSKTIKKKEKIMFSHPFHFHQVYSASSLYFYFHFNPIQTGLFWLSLDWGGGGGGGGCQMPTPLCFLKTIKDIDMKLTPLIKRCEINLLLLSYLNCDIT